MIEYDAIVKLETLGQDENYVLYQSRIDEYEKLEYRHLTEGGHTEKVRGQYYKDIECRQVKKLEYMYKMDLLMFNYSATPFYDLCTESPENKSDRRKIRRFKNKKE